MELQRKPLGNILASLRSAKHYGVSKEVDIAKGVNKYPMTSKDGFKILYRKWRSRKR